MFNRISAIILLVSDMKESMKFYKDVLGMEVKADRRLGRIFKAGNCTCTSPNKGEKEIDEKY
jgi:catechol-2,3-dioxygenase